jgi:branched-chain amino acid transport system substrate-binding protein
MSRPRVSWLLPAVLALAAAGCAGAGGAGTGTGALSGPSGPPITIGISLPLTGDFAADGVATERGYQLWASDVNSHGGLLGRPVTLVIRNDKSDPDVTASQYQALMSTDHVDLTLAPFSSLLTAAALPVVTRHGYAFPAGSAGAPAVYQLKSGSLFSTTVPVKTQLVPFVQWVTSLPPGTRPVTAAYPMVDDPFADPPVQTAQKLLQAAGIQTVYSPAKPYAATSAAALAADAQQVAHSNAQLVVLGSVDVPTVSAFINEFAKLHYNPKVFIASAGPDQGQAFINKVGTSTADGVLVPNGWSGTFPAALSHVMVQDYIAKYGGTASGINADVAEAYSAGEVLAAGVSGAGVLTNKSISSWLHAHQVPTVVGTAKFDSIGENTNTQDSALIFQWQPGAQFVQVLPRTAVGSVPILATKPGWGG